MNINALVFPYLIILKNAYDDNTNKKFKIVFANSFK